ncbi:hypothetical protein AUEXF2481DRAFT_89080 [Aureobasidium subglaciale EXF-2481]|uniref:Cryptic loci regulator 2 N-terminal domain-containing protein n=1 Tax=Aureobasidium subglaciale (strain EXF-2481) TaxID=1043005 RepID=A0A074YG31_AURSE|nr:uncharacterized protein AUEXF2481DRAFT_89080 [Aureobasidium subglaciale EXF-2481]KAI5211611.1 hypothetical protein E4T38_01181 [Aureobasidium subglaciale]KAI5230288.1 hypothetical protein E4T40_01182 [Aureobasidium subglaciale]KAI5233654.1 hypothetical protein E4T41_01180 [Aureobasidium subglaciale]KAI5267003.1 hypothetical protein E4T46_01180 [Aureobasidium subglaciale]KEQ95019.1 hypothetical protein AUEXF2481DRAFT_89080 [Aureobasidium subglaciale EXF-2481]
MAQPQPFPTDLTHYNSDGVVTVIPPDHTAVPIQQFLASLNRRWRNAKNTGLVQQIPWFPDFINGAPTHYTLQSMRSGNAIVLKVFGHPSGRYFRSIDTFLIHVVSIMVGNGFANCNCGLF